MAQSELHNKTFVLLLVVVSGTFAWILWPFFGTVFWAAVLAIIFNPLHHRLLERLHGHRNRAALLTLLLCLVMVILPLGIMTASLIQEGSVIYEQVRTGQLNFGDYFTQIVNALPQWAVNILDRFGLTNIASLREKLTVGAQEGMQFFAKQAVAIGENTFNFIISFGIMLYLLFFLLRDGRELTQRITDALPLSMLHKDILLKKFIAVIRATIKGNVVVAAVQGALGGIMFWFLDIHGALLWGVLMAFLSLLPAVGTPLVWLPVAIYFLVTGAVWQGASLIVFGVAVIGLVDNILRPILVGKDIKMPDYLVLISTLGGMGVFGLEGFVIGPVVAALFMAVWDLFTETHGTPAIKEERSNE